MNRLVNILVISILICLPSGAKGQTPEDPIIGIFNKYEQREGVESISISPAMLRLMQSGRTNDPKTQELVSKITGLRILSISDGTGNRGRASREALATELQEVVRKDFVEFMSVRNAGERVELHVRNIADCRNCTNALLLITSSANSITAMHLSGTIDQSLIDSVMKGEIGLSNR